VAAAWPSGDGVLWNVTEVRDRLEDDGSDDAGAEDDAEE